MASIDAGRILDAGSQPKAVPYVPAIAGRSVRELKAQRRAFLAAPYQGHTSEVQKPIRSNGQLRAVALSLRTLSIVGYWSRISTDRIEDAELQSVCQHKELVDNPIDRLAIVSD
jgi:hypothetical protein